MGFRYDARHLRPDQQAIISRRDEEDKRRTAENKRRIAEVEKQKQKEEFSQIEQLNNDGWEYNGSLQDGVSLRINFKKSGEFEKKTIELKIKENIEKAKTMFAI